MKSDSKITNVKNIIKSIVNQKTFFIKSQGKSMMPLLQPNDIVYYRKTSLGKIKVNDLIMVKKNDHLFTHRVIYLYKKTVFKKDSLFLITKGDNNLNSDGKILPKQIIAKVYQVKRNGKIFHPENLYLLQSTLYFQEIIKIKNAFEKEKIDFVFLKGLPLHLYYEKTHPRRLYLDCDVLVSSKDFSKAEKILLRFGYQKAKTELSSLHKKIKDKEVENAYYKIINGFSVVFDLHLEVVFLMTQLGKLDALYPQSLINQLTEEFLKTKRKVTIQSSNFPLLTSHFQILYLALHFFHHNFRGAFRLEFLDKVIRKSLNKKWEVRSERLDNEVGSEKKNLTSHFKIPTSHFLPLTSFIIQHRLQNFLYPVFILLKKYYQTPLPSSFLKAIKPANPLTEKLINRIIKINIFDDEPRVKAGINRFKNLFFLSPQPWGRKILAFFNPQVLYSVIWVVIYRIFRKK